MSEYPDFTTPDAARVLSVALFRFVNRPLVGRQSIGSLPWNGTEGEMREEDALSMLDDCPGLRFVLEAGVRAVAQDPEFEAWLTSLWSGGSEECETAERRLSERLLPDTEAWAALR